MKRRCAVLVLLCALLLSGCEAASVQPVPTPDSTEYDPVRIKVTAGNVVLYGETNRSRSAYEFAQLLPVRAQVVDYYEFVKAIDLPEPLFGGEVRTREYQIGGFSYWPEGRAVAFFYDDHMEKTVVEVIPLGQLEVGAQQLGGFDGELVIERAVEIQGNEEGQT